MSFSNRPAPDPGNSFLVNLQKQCPNVFLVFFRSKNDNVVVYEARWEDGKVKDIDVYWLEIDAAYRKPRREQGVNHDRVELNALESSLAFGVSSERINDRELQMRFNADSSIPMRVKSDANGARLYVVYEKTPFLVRSAYVSSRDVPNLFKLSDACITELSFNVVNIKTKEPKTHYIKGGVKG